MDSQSSRTENMSSSSHLYALLLREIVSYCTYLFIYLFIEMKCFLEHNKYTLRQDKFIHTRPTATTMPGTVTIWDEKTPKGDWKGHGEIFFTRRRLYLISLMDCLVTLFVLKKQLTQIEAVSSWSPIQLFFKCNILPFNASLKPSRTSPSHPFL